MAITKRDPNTIHLSGHIEYINDVVASAAITPGHLIELHSDSGTPKFQKVGTAAKARSPKIALNRSMLNKGIDDAYAAGDLVEAGVLSPGSVAWMLIASGQAIVPGDQMEAAADGTLIKRASSGIGLFIALEAKTSTVLTRIRVEAM